MGIFGSVMLKLFKMGFFVFVILKFVLLNLSQNSKTHFKVLLKLIF